MMIALLLAAATPTFDPMRFFAGQTRGAGKLKVVLRPHVPVSVRGNGRLEPDGTLVLDQLVVEGDKPPRTRQWRLTRVRPGRYEGTLTDARGKVVADAEGPVLHLSFTTADKFQVQQWLTLAADGRSAANHLQARRFGIVVATLDEKIDKLD